MGVTLAVKAQERDEARPSSPGTKQRRRLGMAPAGLGTDDGKTRRRYGSTPVAGGKGGDGPVLGLRRTPTKTEGTSGAGLLLGA